MSSNAALIIAFTVAFVGPVLGITWYSIRSESHSPPPLQEGGTEAES